LVRIEPALHRKAALRAAAEGLSLSQSISHQIDAAKGLFKNKCFYRFVVPSFPRKRESKASDGSLPLWIPAFAGMTARELKR
jgi:hypothetical protein